MASMESQAVSNWYRTALETIGTHQDWSPAEQHAFFEGWKVLTAEPAGVVCQSVDVDGVEAIWATPEEHGDTVLLCIHGGGFVSGSIHTHRKLFGHIAKAAGARALIVSYPLLPDGTYPIPLDRALTAYRWLLDQNIPADRIGFVGDSAGGGVAVTAQLRGRDEGLPLPGCTLLMSPWIDWAATGESLSSSEGKDVLFSAAWVEQMAAGYLAGTDPRDPAANALYADLAGLGPLCIQVGDQELLLDDSRMLAERATAAGVEVSLEVFPGMQHTFQMMAGHAPEADDAVAKLGEFARARPGTRVA